MKTPAHVAVSLRLAALLYPIFQWKVLLILAGGVIIDIDHYFWYICKYKKFGLLSCYRFLSIETRKNKWKEVIGALFVFHTLEFVLLMILLSFYSNSALMFVIGLLGHYILDFIWHFTVPKRVIVNHSIISWIINNKIRNTL